MSWICTKCDNQIEYLDFTASTQGWESGSATLSKENTPEGHDRVDDFDYSDSGTDETDNYEYKCPECDREIMLDELDWKDEETNERIYLHKECFNCKMTSSKHSL